MDRLFAPRIAIAICVIAAVGFVILVVYGISAASLTAVTLGFAMGAEYYAALGPIDRPLPANEEVHRLFAVATVAHKWWGVHVGAGYGFSAGEKWIAKAILSFDLTPPRHQP